MDFEGETKVEFRIGDAFPADDPVARWLTALAISHNDIRHGTIRLMQPDLQSHEGVYYFRLIASHFKEIAEDLDNSYAEWDEVTAFVDRLPQEARDDFAAVLDTASELEADLGKLRNTLFHYPELDKRKAAKGREKLQQAMRDAADLTGTITTGSKFGAGRFDYADEVIVQFIGENDVAVPLMEKLQAGSFSLWRFAHHAIAAWMEALEPGVVTISSISPAPE
jgi:hypothetical protein